MKHSILRFFSILILVFILVSHFQNCSNVRLTPLTQSVNIASKGGLCTMDPLTLNAKAHYMFIVDKSGSNVVVDPFGRPPSDPMNKKRADSIQSFFTANFAPSTFWGLITFQGVAASDYITQASGSPFTPNQAPFNGAIQRLRTDQDTGGTPFMTALGTAAAAIKQTIDNDPDKDQYYMIFFMSDGYPDGDKTTGETEDQYQLRVKNIITLMRGYLPQRIFMSTVYYGTPEPTSTALMKNMAEWGGGRFIDLGTETSVDFNKLVVKPSKEPYQIKYSHTVVYNLNAAFCEDGRVDVDSDMDGLCDRDEVKYGLNPTERFTTKDADPMKAGYGDFFRYREMKFGEVLPACDSRNDEDNDLLTDCEEAYLKNNTPIGTTLQNPDPKNPDTDGDGLIDGLEFFAFKDKTGATDSSNLSRVYDGEAVDAGTQVLQHRNPKLYDPDAFAYDTQIRPTEINDKGQTCYAFSQTRLELFPTLAVPAGNTLPGLEHAAGENMVLVYFIQTPESDPYAKGIYMRSIQKLQSGNAKSNSGLNVLDSVFTPYVVP